MGPRIPSRKRKKKSTTTGYSTRHNPPRRKWLSSQHETVTKRGIAQVPSRDSFRARKSTKNVIKIRNPDFSELCISLNLQGAQNAGHTKEYTSDRAATA